ncbi:hypothetical protein BGM19_30615 [Streptomyces agglomeratus]|uniref:hypothetical protein n=1 Tax=Streptomyces agglomeratus TaxID=285458 RepID=UPI0008697E02|nr:hypothetical protein [Streptomyces agglomeratus]OEJ61727.1 hypothetical protein BGM19_30615 [Streptomyces agglomeratus]
MRMTTRLLTCAVLAGAALFAAPAPALADSTPSPGAAARDGDEEAAPTEAGTTFRTATKIRPDQRATAEASTGDYLYWAFDADAGSTATVRATVKLPEAAARHGAATWQLDVYDGLRRRQACVHGSQAEAAPKDAASVNLSCTLRTVRAWAEPWADDPLPGSYYVRLTVVDLPQEDLGLPVGAEVVATTRDAGGARAVDGALSVRLVPGASGAEVAEAADDTFSSGWWSSRWLWTAGGGVLGAAAALAGYRLTRGSGRPARVPPGV